MTTILKTAVVLCTLSVAFAGRADAASIAFDNTTPVNIPALTGFVTSGDLMDGTTVTAYFSTGLIESFAWADTGPGAGGVAGTLWGLTLSGDSFNSPWTFSDTSVGRSLTRLVLDGATGLTVFDLTSPAPGTADSANGATFQFLSGIANDDASVAVTYRNPTGIGGALPVGDLFQIVDISFTALGGAGFDGAGFTFRQDSDNDSRLVTNPIPEPGSMILLGTGLAALARRQLKKRQTRTR